MIKQEMNKKKTFYKNNKYSPNKKKIFGFWMYLMSDLILFGSLFSTYAVLNPHSFQFKKNIFNLDLVLFETIVLLLSSFFCGISTISIKKNKINLVFFYLLCSFLLGIMFVFLEFYEFNEFISKGIKPNKDAFYSAFFTLIGIHNVHLIFGLLWMFILIVQLKIHEINNILYTKLKCLNLFWHFLDIIWICIFSIIYLLGTIQ